MLRHCSSSHHQHRHHQSTAATASNTMAAASSTTFSLFFPLHTNKAEFAPVAMAADGFDDDSHSSVTTSPSSPSSSSTGSVDCTLSLGTPSSRRAAETTKQRPACLASCGSVSWDVAATIDPSYCCCCCCQGGSRPAAAAAAAAMNKTAVPCAGHGQDPMLVDRRCANCGTSSTPLWRNGPRGPKSLCNACGIRFKKEERRAAATATAAMDQGGCGYFAQRAQYGAAAAAAAGSAAPVPYGGCEAPAFPCGGGGDVVDAEAVPPQFLAWHLDVVAPAAQAAAFAAVWPERTTRFQYN
ncbi:GATA transcription factor 15 [Sorghum bicolor]|uniref:GATA-type domain-containing protein n=1 Tax=Sorghum bicolor TaxID=4558 RepID=C5YWE1_SORBI|nr:GATA transcription factor 15 [Sorghum bicolor]EES20002.1 hypothetical protein SORBI_3009G243600 [Sorghum bicolor]|eukprot:XP_002441572.1 GATA transcription factor 15 [Sorghum bicolor]